MQLVNSLRKVLTDKYKLTDARIKNAGWKSPPKHVLVACKLAGVPTPFYTNGPFILRQTDHVEPTWFVLQQTENPTSEFKFTHVYMGGEYSPIYHYPLIGHFVEWYRLHETIAFDAALPYVKTTKDLRRSMALLEQTCGREVTLVGKIIDKV